jgi:hypothetical protein
MKLILAGNHGTCEGDSWEFVLPFEYESKEHFLFDVYENKIDMYEKFGYSIRDMKDIENELFTFEEWFERNKIKL